MGGLIHLLSYSTENSVVDYSSGSVHHSRNPLKIALFLRENQLTVLTSNSIFFPCKIFSNTSSKKTRGRFL